MDITEELKKDFELSEAAFNVKYPVHRAAERTAYAEYHSGAAGVQVPSDTDIKTTEAVNVTEEQGAKVTEEPGDEGYIDYFQGAMRGALGATWDATKGVGAGLVRAYDTFITGLAAPITYVTGLEGPERLGESLAQRASGDKGILRPTSGIGEGVAKVTEVIGSMLPLMFATQGLAVARGSALAGTSLAARMTKGAIDSAVYNTVFLDPNEENTAALLHKHSGMNNVILDALRTQEDDPEWERRLKHGVDGVLTSYLFDGLVAGGGKVITPTTKMAKEAALDLFTNRVAKTAQAVKENNVVGEFIGRLEEIRATPVSTQIPVTEVPTATPQYKSGFPKEELGPLTKKKAKTVRETRKQQREAAKQQKEAAKKAKKDTALLKQADLLIASGKPLSDAEQFTVDLAKYIREDQAAKEATDTAITKVQSKAEIAKEIDDANLALMAVGDYGVPLGITKRALKTEVAQTPPPSYTAGLSMLVDDIKGAKGAIFGNTVSKERKAVKEYLVDVMTKISKGTKIDDIVTKLPSELSNLSGPKSASMVMEGLEYYMKKAGQLGGNAASPESKASIAQILRSNGYRTAEIDGIVSGLNETQATLYQRVVAPFARKTIEDTLSTMNKLGNKMAQATEISSDDAREYLRSLGQFMGTRQKSFAGLGLDPDSTMKSIVRDARSKEFNFETLSSMYDDATKTFTRKFLNENPVVNKENLESLRNLAAVVSDATPSELRRLAEGAKAMGFGDKVALMYTANILSGPATQFTATVSNIINHGVRTLGRYAGTTLAGALSSSGFISGTVVGGLPGGLLGGALGSTVGLGLDAMLNPAGFRELVAAAQGAHRGIFTAARYAQAIAKSPWSQSAAKEALDIKTNILGRQAVREGIDKYGYLMAEHGPLMKALMTPAAWALKGLQVMDDVTSLMSFSQNYNAALSREAMKLAGDDPSRYAEFMELFETMYRVDALAEGINALNKTDHRKASVVQAIDRARQLAAKITEDTSLRAPFNPFNFDKIEDETLKQGLRAAVAFTYPMARTNVNAFREFSRYIPGFNLINKDIRDSLSNFATTYSQKGLAHAIAENPGAAEVTMGAFAVCGTTWAIAESLDIRGKTGGDDAYTLRVPGTTVRLNYRSWTGTLGQFMGLFGNVLDARDKALASGDQDKIETYGAATTELMLNAMSSWGSYEFMGGFRELVFAFQDTKSMATYFTRKGLATAVPSHAFFTDLAKSAAGDKMQARTPYEIARTQGLTGLMSTVLTGTTDLYGTYDVMGNKRGSRYLASPSASFNARIVDEIDPAMLILGTLGIDANALDPRSVSFGTGQLEFTPEHFEYYNAQLRKLDMSGVLVEALRPNDPTLSNEVRRQIASSVMSQFRKAAVGRTVSKYPELKLQLKANAEDYVTRVQRAEALLRRGTKL